MVPPANAPIAAVSGSRPFATALAASDGLLVSASAISPSANRRRRSATFCGKAAAGAPQVRMELLEDRQEVLPHQFLGALARRFAQDVGVRHGLDEDLLQERGADEVGRLRIGEAAGVLGGERDELVERLRRRRCAHRRRYRRAGRGPRGIPALPPARRSRSGSRRRSGRGRPAAGWGAFRPIRRQGGAPSPSWRRSSRR